MFISLSLSLSLSLSDAGRLMNYRKRRATIEHKHESLEKTLSRLFYHSIILKNCLALKAYNLLYKKPETLIDLPRKGSQINKKRKITKNGKFGNNSKIRN